MKVIKKSIIDAINHYNSHTESFTQVAEKFNIERRTLSRYIKSNFSTSNLIYVQEKGYYVLFEQKELDMMTDFINNPKMTYTDIENKYNISRKSFQRLCEHNQISYRTYETKYKFNRFAFKTIETEEDAYILGFMLADAYICEQRSALRIKLHSRDEDILHKINKYLNSNVEIKYEYHNVTKNKLSYLYFSSVELTETLKTYGICGNKSCREKFYHKMPNELKRHYIRGLIDGDGYISKDEATPQIGMCGSHDVLYNVAIILKDALNLSINPETIVRYDAGSNIYRLSIYGQKAISVINFLYKDSKIYLDRKYELAKRFF